MRVVAVTGVQTCALPICGGFAFDDFGSYTHHTMVLNGTDGSSSNAGDNITLDRKSVV